MKFSIRLLYLYLFSFVGLLITVIGTIQLVDLTLKNYLFKVNDYYSYPESAMYQEGKPTLSQEELDIRAKRDQDNQFRRQLSNTFAMIAVGVPLYLYHWSTIKKENKK